MMSRLVIISDNITNFELNNNCCQTTIHSRCKQKTNFIFQSNKIFEFTKGNYESRNYQLLEWDVEIVSVILFARKFAFLLNKKINEFKRVCSLINISLR